jgi:16S rRNA A1518/A1519 N6-dimethyltransferase RsmA/KsgA/DIM1 with predicted DNA glycosylase/AP lyase activity
MLRKSLKTFAAKHELEAAQWCEACGIDPQKRPEELPPKAFQTLTEFVVSTRA